MKEGADANELMRQLDRRIEIWNQAVFGGFLKVADGFGVDDDELVEIVTHRFGPDIGDMLDNWLDEDDESEDESNEAD